MSQSYEVDGRGLSARQLFLCGLALLVALALLTVLLMMRSNGRFENYTRIVANMNNVGDGLPENSDVKYHGMIVGTVSGVEPGMNGAPNKVMINLEERHAGAIPKTVTARVIPSNVFAVSAVQLIDNGSGPAIRSGDQITQDNTLPTVVFQTTISKLRDVLFATGRGREDRTIGVLEAVQVATQNRRPKLLTSGAQLDRLLSELDGIIATDPNDTTVSALINVADGLKSTAPELVDALHQAIEPMKTFVEQKSALDSMISAGLNTLGTTQTALANHSDQMVRITGDLTPVLGSLAQQSNNFVPAFQKLNVVSSKFFDDVWIPEVDTPNMRINLALAPTYTYSRADCPTYGALKGNSCFTAPLIPVRPDLPEVLLPQNYQPPADLAPPSGTVLGPNGNLVAVGPPLINPNPNLADPNPPLPPGFTPAPPVPLTANPANVDPPAAPAPAAPAEQPPAEQPPAGSFPAEVAAPASFGGTVGPVGSAKERVQLSVMTGRPATPATQVLLGPLVRGMTVNVGNAEPAAIKPASATTATTGGPR